MTIHNLTVQIGRTLTIGTGRILTINGNPTAASVNIGGGGGGTVTASGTGLFRTQGTVTFSSSGGTFSAPFEVNSGTTTVSVATFSGAITVAPAATLVVQSGATVVANGDVTMNGTLSSTSGERSAAGLWHIQRRVQD